MNFQGLHRTIQFSISSLALGKRQKHNISRIFCFANRFLNFFRFFFKTESFKLRSAKFSGIYISLAASPFSARNRNIIYHRFFVLQIVFETFFKFFQNDQQKHLCLYQPRRAPLKRRNRDIIYHHFGTLQAIF